jgi:ParB-like chromosome segregation protein Spo0J
MSETSGEKSLREKAVKLQELEIEYVAIDELVPNLYNPNRQNEHEFDLLKRSILEDGFTQPIIVGADGKIVDGEHRWRAARELGQERIPIVRIPMEAAQARIATLRHNRARGTEDIELSVAVLADLETLGALDWAVDSLQIDAEELQRLRDNVPVPEALAADAFGQAWTPVAGDNQVDAEGARADTTEAAQEAVADRQRRLDAAGSEDERQAIRRERALYRVVLTFTDQEAEVVKAALGDQPAIGLLDLCREAQEAA